MKKLFIFIVLVIGVVIVYEAGKKLYFIGKDSNENGTIEEKKKEDKKEEEKEKYTSIEKEKLSKINYINEKINYFKFSYIDRYVAYKEKNPALSDEDVVLYVNIGLDNKFYTNTKETINPDSLLVLANKYYYLSNTYVPKNLETISSAYSSGTRQVQHEARIAFEDMALNAKKEGYTIRAVSTYRSYSYQNNLYNRYVSNSSVESADTYSARPGFSEHQTGLALDIDNAKVSYTSFGTTKEYLWMQENAYKYGFILRYTTENQFITGYISEAWHYRYVGIEVATLMRNENIKSFEEYYVKYIEKDV